MTNINHTDIAIPRYAFQIDPETENPVFRISKNDSVVNYNKVDFLIPHRKDYYFFAFVKKGSSRHWIDMKPYTLKNNTFYFTVPQQVHLKEETKPLSGISFSFPRELLEMDGSGMLKELPLIKNPHNGHELALNTADLTFIEDLLEKIYAEYHTHAHWQHTMILAYMKVLLIYLSRLYNDQFSDLPPSTERLMLHNFLEQVDTMYRQHHEVTAYADVLNISAGHLSDVIKQQSGKPAITHIHERMLLEARRLLFHTDQSVKEIAFTLGFEDASYFNRFFKRMTDQTPVQYRNTTRKMYH